MRFSNANTTTDRYRFGAGPGFPHVVVAAGGRAEVVDVVGADAVVVLVDDVGEVADVAFVVVVETAAVGRPAELHPAITNATHAETIAALTSEPRRRAGGPTQISDVMTSRAFHTC